MYSLVQNARVWQIATMPHEQNAWVGRPQLTHTIALLRYTDATY